MNTGRCQPTGIAIEEVPEKTMREALDLDPRLHGEKPSRTAKK
ncbi:hypothetical protein [Rahnella perminowiae]|nr:hypothetical protein [Rahnella perminowiae]MCR9003715.1 hypothetical protein [Rahnella perminowiae]